MTRADEFRKNAVESRLQAERSRNHLNKEHWLKIAALWLQMAEEADDDDKRGGQ
jgi:hypothetical protein